MWFLFGLIAIPATFLNLYLYVTGKDYKLALVLSFTVLTVVVDYRMVSDWVKAEDWPPLLDVV